MNQLLPRLNSWQFIFIGLLACQGTSFSFSLLATAPPMLYLMFIRSARPIYFKKSRAREEFQYFLRYVLM